jgi:Flp pilus assembly protein TadG
MSRTGKAPPLNHNLAMRPMTMCRMNFPSAAWNLMGFARRRVSWRRATAALEFAMATPLLVIMLGGAADYGLAEYYRTNLANAVAAGAEYAYLTYSATGSVTVANIQSVITNAMYLPGGTSGNLTWNITPPPWGHCVYAGSPPTMTSATPGSVCTGDGSIAGTYITITVTYTSTGIMHGFDAVLSQPMTESAFVRLN